MTEQQAEQLLSMLQTAAQTGRTDYAQAVSTWQSMMDTFHQYAGSLTDGIIVLMVLGIVQVCLLGFLVAFVVTRR